MNAYDINSAVDGVRKGDAEPSLQKTPSTASLGRLSKSGSASVPPRASRIDLEVISEKSKEFFVLVKRLKRNKMMFSITRDLDVLDHYLEHRIED